MKLKTLSHAVMLGSTMLLSQGAFAQEEAQSNIQAELDTLKTKIEQLEKNQASSNSIALSNVDDKAVSFNGFYSVGLSKLSEDDYTYEGGQDGEVNTKPNTMVGLQLNANIYEGGEFVTQIIAKGYDEGKSDFEPQVEWLYWKHDFGSGFDAQVGRIRFPLFMESGNYNVGYSYPWISAPTSVYGVLELTNIDGASLNYNTTMGDWNLGLKALWGNGDISWSEGSANLKDIYGLVVTTGTDELTLRLAYMQAEQNWDSFTVLPAGTLGPMSPETKLTFVFGDELTYAVAGLKYDNGALYLSAEGIQISADDGALPEENSWNTTFGWRFGNVMPYIGYSETKVDNADTLGAAIDAQYTARGDSPIQIPAAGPFPAVTAGDLSQRVLIEEQTTYIAGVRWDFMPKTALKVQVQQMKDFNGTIGNFSNSSAAGMPVGDVLPFEDVMLYEIAIQGVF